MRSRLAASALVLLSACGGSPTGPSTPPPTPLTITGHLRSTNGGQVIAGATVRNARGETVTTDAAGLFRFSVLPTSALRLTITGPLVDREVSVQANGSRDVDVEGFVENGTFDLDYFRQVARGALDHDALEPIRRWTDHPRVYLRTVDEAGRAMQDATLRMVDTAIRATVPAFTAGRYTVAAVERGPDTRVGTAGWITVRWVPGNTTHCGRSTIGSSGGYIELHYQTPRCACGGFQIAPRTVKHEVGHAMGFWHSPDAADLMIVSSGPCDRTLSARERQYAAYLYARPVGNLDPDRDPVGTVLLQPVTVH